MALQAGLAATQVRTKAAAAAWAHVVTAVVAWVHAAAVMYN